MDKVDDRVAETYERIEKAGRSASEVILVAVTKKFGLDAIQAAQAAGLGDVGENYAQEARGKFDELSGLGLAQPTWHFIGQLQRNKVKLLAPFVDVWQTVDNIALADEIAKRAPGASIFVQVNSSDEESRGGCKWADVDALVDHARSLELKVCGLMGVAPLGEADEARPYFQRLAQKANKLGLPELSMGMSADLEIAVQEGSTMLRIGSALFGARN